MVIHIAVNDRLAVEFPFRGKEVIALAGSLLSALGDHCLPSVRTYSSRKEELNPASSLGDAEDTSLSDTGIVDDNNGTVINQRWEILHHHICIGTCFSVYYQKPVFAAFLCRSLCYQLLRKIESELADFHISLRTGPMYPGCPQFRRSPEDSCFRCCSSDFPSDSQDQEAHRPWQ